MIRILTTILFMISTYTLAYDQEMRPIESWEYSYMSQAFPQAVYVKQVRIEDSPTLTSGEPNTFIHEIYDIRKNLVGYVRDVYTSAGCVDVCSPLDFTITFDSAGKFFMVLQRDQMPLEKDFGADFFNTDDYKKLHIFLTETPEIFKAANRPTDLVDAVTSATKLEYADYIVSTAAMSCFKIYLYKNQTESQLIQK